jgi:hypothetical protein
MHNSANMLYVYSQATNLEAYLHRRADLRPWRLQDVFQ